jgi:hypothetical protein
MAAAPKSAESEERMMSFLPVFDCGTKRARRWLWNNTE